MSSFRPETWMTDLSHLISKRKLTDLFIPGSHDSAITYDCLSTTLGPDAPDIVKNYGSWLSWVVQNWAVTQKLSLHDQLLGGIRYFDLRIAKIDGVFKFTHALQSHLDIFTLLTPVAEFMRTHPGEVIIIHCQHFFDMQADYDALLAGFQSLFSDMLAPKTIMQDEFQAYIDTDKRVVLIWGDNATASLKNSSLVCDEAAVLSSRWDPNQMKTKEALLQFLIKSQNDRPNPDPRLSVIQGILDCSEFDLKLIPSFTLLNFEHDLNEYLRTNLLPKLGSHRGFIYMTDNVKYPDGRGIETVIMLNGEGWQNFQSLVKDAGLDRWEIKTNSWIQSQAGVPYHDIGFSGDRALLGNTVHSIRGQGSMSFSASYGFLTVQEGTLSFPPDPSIRGLVLCARVHNMWGDDTNGKWKVMSNILGQTSVEVQVQSARSRGTHWELEVWYIPLP